VDVESRLSRFSSAVRLAFTPLCFQRYQNNLLYVDDFRDMKRFVPSVLEGRADQPAAVIEDDMSVMEFRVETNFDCESLFPEILQRLFEARLNGIGPFTHKQAYWLFGISETVESADSNVWVYHEYFRFGFLQELADLSNTFNAVVALEEQYSRRTGN
jgi:hypothetical protein